MNCKQGDIALIVRSRAGNEGKIVRCIRLLTAAEADAISYWSGPVWLVDKPIRSTLKGMKRMVPNCPDSQLRPIRDPGDDAQDESKAWLPPVPTKEHA